MLRCGNSLRSKLLISSPFHGKTTNHKSSLLFRRSSKQQQQQQQQQQQSSLTDSASSSSQKSIKATELNLEEVALKNGVRLTKTEVKDLRRMLDVNKDGRVSMAELQKAGKIALEKQWTRELCLQVVEQPNTRHLQTANKLLSVLDFGGTALFAVVGTQLAGEKDFNLVGCTLIGCIAAMGGGSLNAMLYGSSAQLLASHGVFWVRMPSYLMLTVGVSMLTFYTWPTYCREKATNKVKDAVGVNQITKDGTINKKAFVKACEKDPDIAAGFAAAFKMPDATPAELFDKADVRKTGKVSTKEIQVVLAKKFDFGSSVMMYTIDTLAMAAFAVVGVNGAVQQGLHPLVAATSGVTICFGGILRDVLCGRDLAIGGQSYAFAMGAGSGMYVLLRELRLRGFPCPLIARIIIAFATTTGVRVLEYVRGEPLLRPMHYYRDDENLQIIRHVGGQNDPAHDWLTDVKSDELVP